MVSFPPDLKLTHLLQEALRKKGCYAQHGPKWYAKQKEKREEKKKARLEEKMAILRGRLTKKGAGKKSRK